MAPFSLYQVNPSPSSAAYMRHWTGTEWSVKCLLDTWLGIGANWHHKSVWCTLMSDTHMDVILWSVCYFHAYCTMCYIAPFICPALSLGSKCTKLFHAALNIRKYLLAYQPSAFYAKLAGLFPRVSVRCIVHPANEVTPHTDWALPGDQIVANHELNRVHGVGHGGIDIEQGNRIPCLNQLLVEPVPLNTVKLPIR